MCRLDKKNNITWIDPCKGVGIYLVVLGHCNIQPALQHFIYLFHMPLFFFVSGYLHTTRDDLGAYFKRKAIHLLVPYVAFLLLLYPLELGRVFFHHGAGPFFNSALLAGLWGGARLQGLYGVFWFLPCLFMTQQIMNLLLARYRGLTLFSLVSLATCVSYLNARLAPQFSLPLDANVVLAAVPFFYLGYLGRSVPQRFERVLAVIAMAGAGFGAYLVYLGRPVFYNMRIGIYGMPGLSLVLAICCIVCLIALTRISPAQGVLARLGAASMGIMFIHKQLPVIAPLNNWAMRHGYVASIVFTAISLMLAELLRHTVITRALLLGSEGDFHKLEFSTGRIVETHATSGV
jgi:polysaccharide biosynthesis protein PslL